MARDVILAPEHRAHPMRFWRRYSVIPTFLFGGLAAFAGCGDDPIAPDEPTLASGSLTAVVDGEGWMAAFVAAGSSGDTIYSVVGVDSTSASIGFLIPGNVRGSYTIGTGSAAFAFYLTNAGQENWNADSSQGSGTIVVTTLTATRIAGTFTFQAVTVTQSTPTTVTVTNGVFDILF